MKQPPSVVIISYGCDQPFYDEFKQLGYPLRLIKGIPTVDEIPVNALIIFDDMQEYASLIEPFFTKYVHHLRISVIYITQNLYLKHNRTITLNSLYIILFKSPRCKRQIQTISQQMAPGDSKWIINAYATATQLPHTYLLFDYNQMTSEDARIRDDIVPQDSTVYVNDPTLYPKFDIYSYVASLH